MLVPLYLPVRPACICGSPRVRFTGFMDKMWSLRSEKASSVLYLACLGSALINQKVKSDPFYLAIWLHTNLAGFCPIGVGLMGLQMCKVLYRSPLLGHSEVQALTSCWTLNTSSQEAQAPSLLLVP